MAWYYLFDATGRLVSESSDDALSGEAPPGLSVLTRQGRVDVATEMWEATLRAFIPRPAKVLLDRLDDLKTDSRLVSLWSQLPAAETAALEAAFVRLLGARRYRSSTASSEDQR